MRPARALTEAGKQAVGPEVRAWAQANRAILPGIRQYAFQEAYYGVEKYGAAKAWGRYISHYAVGARCARPL